MRLTNVTANPTAECVARQITEPDIEQTEHALFTRPHFAS
jgi:hypothetical protein